MFLGIGVTPSGIGRLFSHAGVTLGVRRGRAFRNTGRHLFRTYNTNTCRVYSEGLCVRSIFPGKRVKLCGAPRRLFHLVSSTLYGSGSVRTRGTCSVIVNRRAFVGEMGRVLV